MEQTKILVVDDDREIVGAIAALLELEGYTVLRAYDGLEALDALHTHDVQLMILDVMMPRMDGLETLERLLRNELIPPENEDEKKRTLTDLLRRKKEGNDHVE